MLTSADVPAKEWFLIHTGHRDPDAVAAFLNAAGCEAFVPCAGARRAWTMPEALFPGHIFVALDPELDAGLLERHAPKARFVTNDHRRPLSIPVIVVMALRTPEGDIDSSLQQTLSVMAPEYRLDALKSEMMRWSSHPEL